MSSVELLPVPPGCELESLVPADCTLVKGWQAACGPGSFALCCRVERLERQITPELHLVKTPRTRCVLRCIASGERAYCWFFGEYSTGAARLGVRDGDAVVVVRPRVVPTKVKWKQVLPPDLGPWTVHCTASPAPMDGGPASGPVIFAREDETGREVGAGVVRASAVQPRSPARVAGRGNSKQQQQPSVAPYGTTDTSTVWNGPVEPSVFRVPVTPSYNYTNLANCTAAKGRYHAWAVVMDMLQPPMQCKSKVVSKLLVRDESLATGAGGIGDCYKFDILVERVEDMPRLEPGAVLRIHHMRVEVFNGVADGRVYGAGCVTVVRGGPGDPLLPESGRAGGPTGWSPAAAARVEALRVCYSEARPAVRSVEELRGPGVARLHARLLTVITLPRAGRLLRLEDGTRSEVVSVEWRGEECDTQEQAGANKHFLDVWVVGPDQLNTVDRLQLQQGDWLCVERLRCEREQQEGGSYYRFLVEDGDITRLEPLDHVTAAARERLGEQPPPPNKVSEFIQALQKPGLYAHLGDSFESEGLQFSDSLVGPEHVQQVQEESEPNSEEMQVDGKPTSLSPESSRSGETAEDTPSLAGITALTNKEVPAAAETEVSLQPSSEMEIVAENEEGEEKEAENPFERSLTITLPSLPCAQASVGGPENDNWSQMSEFSQQQPPMQPGPYLSSGLTSPESFDTPCASPGSEKSQSDAAPMQPGPYLSSGITSPESFDTPCVSSGLTSPESFGTPCPSPGSEKSQSDADVSASGFMSSLSALAARVFSPFSSSSKPRTPEAAAKTSEESEDNYEEKSFMDTPSAIGTEDLKTIGKSHEEDSSVLVLDYSQNSDFEMSQISEEPDGILNEESDLNFKEIKAKEIETKENSEVEIQTSEVVNEVAAAAEVSEVAAVTGEAVPAEGVEVAAPAEIVNEAAPAEGVNVSAAAGGVDVSEMRQRLTVVCSSRTLPRVTCSRLDSCTAGRWRLLCLISHLETVENNLRPLHGHCSVCSKDAVLQAFSMQEGQHTCCGGPVAVRLQFTLFVHDQTNNPNEGVKLVVRGAAAETFVSTTTEQLMANMTVRRDVVRRLRDIQGTVGEFGIEKEDSGEIFVKDTSVKVE